MRSVQVAGLLVVLVSVLVAPAAGRTWHVAQDGSGDFTVIQDAIDAASAGDEIRIHAGRYEELTVGYDHNGNGTPDFDVHVIVDKNDLTLVGDGAEATIIGPASRQGERDNNYLGISFVESGSTGLTIRDLAIEGVEYGVIAWCDDLAVQGCRFQGIRGGGCLYLEAHSSALIERCRFVDCGTGGHTLYPTSNLVIRDCELEECLYGFWIMGTAGFLIEDTTFDCGTTLNVQQGSFGTVRNTTMTVTGEYGYGVGLSLDGHVQLRDCEITGGHRGILISHGSTVDAARVRIGGQSATCLWVYSTAGSVFRDCEILNGGGDSVRCLSTQSPGCVLDMEGCYWGTDSAAQIAAWIQDHEDNPHDCCVVDFEPFADGPVPVDRQSWSEVKALFRGAR